MSSQNLTTPSTPPHFDSPQTNGSVHPKPPDEPSSSDHGDDAEPQAPDPALRRGSKQLALTPSALGDKFTEKKDKLKEKAKKPPGGFDRTPLPDAPQGYTIQITFHRASNLPIGDMHLKSSDPFIHATLTAAVPKRHKEDPPLTRRTRTVRRTTEPVWDEDWVVANVPASGFVLKCRLYDEDWPDHDDRLGNVTIRVPRVSEDWEGLGPEGRVFEVKKRAGSKRAYLLKGVMSLCGGEGVTASLQVGMRVLGRSDPPHAQMYTVGPTTWVKHYSPMIGRLAGVRVNRDEEHDAAAAGGATERGTKKYDFQANEIQLSGPVPPELYHRYVEFRPMIGRMFSSRGIRGTILHALLHKQHQRIYNYDSSTEYGSFEACSEDASLQFLRMAHFDEGGRIFTYVLTLDGMLRFTETGKEFGIDMLSKHTMHSDVATYIACSGEFFIQRLPGHEHEHVHRHQHRRHRHRRHPSTVSHADSHDLEAPSSPISQDPEGPSNSDPEPSTSAAPSSPRSHCRQNSHASSHHTRHSTASSQPAKEKRKEKEEKEENPPLPPPNPHIYHLIIDNDSGTYRPDESILPLLQSFLARNLPGLQVTAMHCADEKLGEMKKAQREIKKKAAGRGGVRIVMQRGGSLSSLSSSDEGGSQGGEEEEVKVGRGKREKLFDAVNGVGRLWGGGEKKGR